MCYCWFVDGMIVREDNQIIVGCTPQENATDGQDFYCLGYLWNTMVEYYMYRYRYRIFLRRPRALIWSQSHSLQV